MSNQHLPTELLDHIVDHLHASRDALKSCCLVSKSWIPRARNHLFTKIKFSTAKSLQSWRSTFPDPSTSPAYYTRILDIRCLQAIVAADTEERAWVSTFTRVVDFVVDVPGRYTNQLPISLVPFYGFSPDLKSLHLSSRVIPLSQLFGLIYSFPLLEDLSVTCFDEWIGNDDASQDNHAAAIRTSTPPVFTGLLKLDLENELDFMASRLSSLPSGPHFRRLHLTLNQQKDALSVTALVETCRRTLKYLEIESELFDLPLSGTIDLSKAMELKDLVFECETDPQWITAALQTVTRDHINLRRVSILVPEKLYNFDFRSVDSFNIMHTTRETTYQAWLELDRLLAQLSELHSIRPEIVYDVPSWVNRKEARSSMEVLLPELTKRGIVEMMERGPMWLIPEHWHRE